MSWAWTPLSDVARLESGHTPSRRIDAYWEGGEVPWLSLKDIRGLSSKYVTETVDHPTMLGIANSSARLLPKGTVALCRTASVGNVAILGKEMATSQDFVNWVCGEQLLPEYLYWAFKGSEATFSLEKQGSTHQTIYMPTVARFHILLPPLPEQRRIAEVLDRAEALRAKRRAALAQLDDLTQAIFLDLFGDPATNPKGWPRTSLGELIATGPQNGLYKPASDYGSGTPILRIDAFYDGEVTKLTTLKRVRVSDEERDLYGLRVGDIVVNRVNSMEYLGKSALIPDLDEPTVFESNVMRFDVALKTVQPSYVVQFLQSKFIKKQILTAAKNAVNQSSINQQDVKGFQVNVPPLSLQRDFARRIAAVEKLKAAHRASLAELDALFSALQHRAFRGEL